MAGMKMYYLLFLAVLAAGQYEEYPGKVYDCPYESGRQHCQCGKMDYDPPSPECIIDYSTYPYVPLPLYCWYNSDQCAVCALNGGMYALGDPYTQGGHWCAPCVPQCQACSGLLLDDLFYYNPVLCNGMNFWMPGLPAPDGPVQCTSGHWVNPGPITPGGNAEPYCEACDDENAASCNTDKALSSRCNQGYYLVDDWCEPCTGTGGAPAVGDCACSGTYGSGTCSSCLTDCAWCEDGSSCKKCNHGLVWDMGSDSCMTHPWHDLPAPWN